MQPKSAVMMRVLLNRFYKGSPESFLGCLPEEDINAILKADVKSNDPTFALKGLWEKINSIHYSWFKAWVEKLPKENQDVAVFSFPDDYAGKLSQALKISRLPTPLAQIVKEYFVGLAYKHLVGEAELLPKEYLPQTPLSPLGDLNKNELVELVEFLGLHDLADELRQIVDQKTLKSVYGCLIPKEQHYLRFCMQQKERVAAPSLGLERWGGDCEKLKGVLQSRGIMRLGKALSTEHPGFLWHIGHTFDTGRGQALMKYSSQKTLPGIASALAQQVLNLLNILKKKSEV